jgi:hypothetical protein
MRYDEELIDVDEALVREAIRTVAQEALRAVTGRLDTDVQRYAVTPLGRVALDAPARTPARGEDVLELADESPRARHIRQEREAAVIFRSENNSAFATIDRR